VIQFTVERVNSALAQASPAEMDRDERKASLALTSRFLLVH
jgi:hypothetical protein